MGLKELALNGTGIPFPLFGHQSNAGIRSVTVRPFTPQPHALDASRPDQGDLHQAFKGAAHTKQTGDTVADKGQGLVKLRHMLSGFPVTVQSSSMPC